MEVGDEEEAEARFSGDEGEVKVEDEEGARAGKARDTLAMLKARVRRNSGSGLRTVADVPTQKKTRRPVEDPDEDDGGPPAGKRGKQL